MYEFINFVFICEIIYKFDMWISNHIIYIYIYIYIDMTLLGTPEIMLFYEFIYEFMIFYEVIYEFWYEIFARTLLAVLGTPVFIVFHKIMPDFIDFGLFSWEASYWKSCLTNVVKNIVYSCISHPMHHSKILENFHDLPILYRQTFPSFDNPGIWRMECHPTVML